MYNPDDETESRLHYFVITVVTCVRLPFLYPRRDIRASRLLAFVDDTNTHTSTLSLTILRANT